MHRIATSAAGDVHKFIDAEGTFARGRGTDGIGFIGKTNVERFAVDVAEDSGRPYPKFAAGAKDAHSGFTAIGDQDFREHRGAKRGKMLAWRETRQDRSGSSAFPISYFRSFFRSIHLTRMTLF